MEKIKDALTKLILITPFLVVAMFLCAITKTYAFADVVELNTLINESRLYDGQTVVVKGEALLEALERKNFAWVNINDGTNAMGVVMSYESIEKIKVYGDFKKKGDVIEIEATFHRSCIEHGGDMDLHLVRLLSVTPGGEVSHPVTKNKLIIALISIIGMLASLFLYRDKRHKFIKK